MPGSDASRPARLTAQDAQQRYPRVYAAVAAPDAHDFLTALDATEFAALLAELRALGPARLERRPAADRAR